MSKIKIPKLIFGEWQCCPCCGGLGYMEVARLVGTVLDNSCPVCQGQKIIQRPIVEKIMIEIDQDA